MRKGLLWLSEQPKIFNFVRNAVEYARINSSDAKYDANLFNLLDPSKTQSLTNTGTFASTTGAVKRKFGFLAPSSTTIIRAYATL